MTFDPNAAEKLAPHSSDAEEAVLACCLMTESLPDEIAARVKADDFFVIRNAYIYEAITALHDSQQPIDYIVLCQKLREMGYLEQIGGAAYLTYLLNNLPTHIHAEIYAKQVERLSYRRRLLDMATKIGQIALQDNADIPDIRTAIETEYYAVEERGKSADTITMQELASEFFDDVEYRYAHQGEPDGVPTCYTDLDTLLGGGPQKGDLVILAARTAFGKTALALNIAHNEAKAGIPVAIESIEMKPKQLYGRLAAIEATIDSQKFRSGALNAEEWDRFTESSSRLAKLPIFFDKAYTSSHLKIGANLRKLKRIHGIQVAFVDYLQLMASSDPKFQTAEIGVITRYFKLLAQELNIPIWLLCQLNRDVEKRNDKRPQLSDLRQSGSIEQDADTVLFIYRDEMYNPNTLDKGKAEIIAGKSRNGAIGSIDLSYNAKYTRFANVNETHTNLNDLLI